MIPFPDKKYQIIYADPPWHYRDKRTNPLTDRPPKYGGIVYPVMKTEDICSLPVKDIADSNCMLFIWATFPILKKSFKVIESWGFQYKTVAFTWIKTNRNCRKIFITEKDIFFGIGYYTKSNCEVCLLAVKGKPIKVSNKVSSVVLSPLTSHSTKPPEVREKILELCGNLARIELFARQKTEGWDVWGNEV
jgi:N6-adenosine-specific RNA methylase IME4